MKQILTVRRFIETILFGTRWILPLFYLIIAFSLILYCFFDIREFIGYLSNLNKFDKTSAMLTFIELIDLTMIANLGKMVITGSYNSFVDKNHGYKNENISSGLLKVKMSTSLVGVTAIALLQRAVEVDKFNNLLTSWDTLYKLGFIHSLFLLGSLVLETVDFFHEKVELQRDIFEFEKEKFEFEKEKFIFEREKTKLNVHQ